MLQFQNQHQITQQHDDFFQPHFYQVQHREQNHQLYQRYLSQSQQSQVSVHSFDYNSHLHGMNVEAIPLGSELPYQISQKNSCNKHQLPHSILSINKCCCKCHSCSCCCSSNHNFGELEGYLRLNYPQILSDFMKTGNNGNNYVKSGTSNDFVSKRQQSVGNINSNAQIVRYEQEIQSKVQNNHFADVKNDSQNYFAEDIMAVSSTLHSGIQLSSQQKAPEELYCSKYLENSVNADKFLGCNPNSSNEIELTSNTQELLNSAKDFSVYSSLKASDQNAIYCDFNLPTENEYIEEYVDLSHLELDSSTNSLSSFTAQVFKASDREFDFYFNK